MVTILLIWRFIVVVTSYEGFAIKIFAIKGIYLSLTPQIQHAITLQYRMVEFLINVHML